MNDSSTKGPGNPGAFFHAPTVTCPMCGEPAPPPSLAGRPWAAGLEITALWRHGPRACLGRRWREHGSRAPVLAAPPGPAWGLLTRAVGLCPAGLATLTPVRAVLGNTPGQTGDLARLGPILAIGTGPDLEITPGRGEVAGVRTLAVDLTRASTLLAGVAFGKPSDDLRWLCS